MRTSPLRILRNSHSPGPNGQGASGRGRRRLGVLLLLTHPGEQLSALRRGAHPLGAQNLEKPRRFDPAAGVLGSECPIPVGMLIGGVHSLLALPQGHREHPAVRPVAEEPVATITTLHPERGDDVLFGCAQGLILALWGYGPLAYTGKHTDHHLSPLLRALTLCFNPPECLQQVFCELRLYGVLGSSEHQCVERSSVRRVMSSSCSRPSPVKRSSSFIRVAP